MSDLFIYVLNMSIIASYVGLIVIVVRFALKKFHMPNIIPYVLWGVVLFRLICPISFESTFSLIPVNTDTVPYDIVYSQNPSISTGSNIVDNSINQSIQVFSTPVDQTISVNPLGVFMEIAATIWVLGIIGFIIYGVVSYSRLKIRLSTAILVEENIFKTDRIKTPFVLGFIKPKIYIPINLAEEELNYILKHEQTHIRRRDYLVKPIAYLALILHWFNPLIWVSYFLMVKDMEMSCDESVMKNTDSDIRSNYSKSLLSLSVQQNRLISPLAFGESNVKSRIKNVLNYKKSVFWIIIISVVVVLVIAAGLLVNPKDDGPDLSLLNIDNALKSIATSSNVIVELENNSLLTFKPNAEFLTSFNQNKWREKKVNSPIESIPSITFYINDGYYLNLYSDEDIAMIFLVDSKEKYRYYTIPDGTYEAVESYVLQNGELYEKEDTKLGKEIEEYLDKIMSSPKSSSNPGDYINAHQNEYENIIKLGDEALEYLFSEFEAGNSNGLRGHIMMQLCKDILGVRNNVTDESLLPQEWYFQLSIYEETILPNFVYDGKDLIEKLVYNTEIEKSINPYQDGFIVVAPKIHAYYEEGNKLKVFVTTYYSTYSLYDKVLSENGGGVVPAAITYVKNENGNYSLEEYEQAMDGSYFSKSIRDYSTMPVSGEKIEELADIILNHYGNYDDLFILHKENLIKHLKDNNQYGVNLKRFNGEIIPLT